MSVLVYISSEDGNVKKSAFESLAYARLLADKTDAKVCAVGFGIKDYADIESAGAGKIYNISSDVLKVFDVGNYAHVLLKIAKEEKISTIVMDVRSHSKILASYLAVRLNAEYVSNVVSVPVRTEPYEIMRRCFSGKAHALVEVCTPVKIIGIAAKVFSPEKFDTTADIVETQFEEFPNPAPTITEKNTPQGKMSISDADIVISGGRGLKSPENWKVIEDLANTIGGALACSKAVSDLGWRPHSEHVGQTGRLIAPNIYIAVGISGAIQHIAGISDSRIKIVVNKDPEAPFFRVADYGIVGDAMDIIPKLTQKLKAVS